MFALSKPKLGVWNKLRTKKRFLHRLSEQPDGVMTWSRSSFFMICLRLSLCVLGFPFACKQNTMTLLKHTGWDTAFGPILRVNVHLSASILPMTTSIFLNFCFLNYCFNQNQTKLTWLLSLYFRFDYPLIDGTLNRAWQNSVFWEAKKKELPGEI